MKINEKLVAVAVATSMVVPTIMPIMATGEQTTTVSGTTEATTGTTTATYVVSQSYSWTVPTNITFTDDNNAQTCEVAVTKNVIDPDKKLQITISGNGGGTGNNAADADQFRVSNGNHYLNYTVSTGGSTTLNSEGSVLEVAAGTNTKEQSLTFTLDTTNLESSDTAKVSGTYTGKVIYTARVVSDTD